MTKLNDAQLILLSKAAARDSGSIYPISETLAADRVPKAISGLLKRALTEERETADTASIYRTDGDLRFGMLVLSV